jgi:hypothetical protein
MAHPRQLDQLESVSSAIRPYNSAIGDQGEYGVATITLLKSGNSGTSLADTDIAKKYATNLDQGVETLKSEEDTGPGNTGAEGAFSIGEIPRTDLTEDYEYYGVFNNFSLFQVNELRDQIVKIHNNFGGAWSAFFFGEKPRIYSFAGFFLDSPLYPYYQEFTVAYEKWLAGRKCIQNQMMMKLAYDGKIVDGYLLNVETVTKSENQYHKAFNFTVLVSGERFFRYNFVTKTPNQPMTRELNAMTNVDPQKNRAAASVDILSLYGAAEFQQKNGGNGNA